MSDTCRSCGAPIVWIETKDGKHLCLETKVLTIYDENGVAHRGREPHWASCPDAKHWRGRPR